MIPRLHCPRLRATAGEVAEFSPEQSRRLFRVLRTRPGDAVVLFDGDGNEFAADIVSLRPDHGSARIVSRRPPPAADFGIRARVGQGLCAPNKMDWAVEKMTELGAAQIIPLRTAKTAAVRFSAERARRLAAAACEQCGRATVPKVDDLENIADFLSRPFPHARKILLSPRAENSLAEVLKGADDAEIVLLCGPESGLTSDEAEAAEAAGFVSANLGARILRTETAALAALAALG